MYDRLNLTRFLPRRTLNFEGFFVWQGMNRISLFPFLRHGNLLFLLVLPYRAVNFLFIRCQHRTLAREFSVLRHCPLFIQSPLSLSDVFASLVNKERVAACIK